MLVWGWCHDKAKTAKEEKINSRKYKKPTNNLITIFQIFFRFANIVFSLLLYVLMIVTPYTDLCFDYLSCLCIAMLSHVSSRCFLKFQFLGCTCSFPFAYKEERFLPSLPFPSWDLFCFHSYSIPDLLQTIIISAFSVQIRHPEPCTCFIPVSDPCLDQPEISCDSLQLDSGPNDCGFAGTQNSLVRWELQACVVKTKLIKRFPATCFAPAQTMQQPLGSNGDLECYQHVVEEVYTHVWQAVLLCLWICSWCRQTGAV
jgi:hypothetical protein